MPARILIVDGAAASRALLKAKLTQAYFDVVTADTTSAALAAVRSYAPDLVMVDAGAGAPDGYALCVDLQSEARLLGVPLIMTLPQDDADAPLRALAAGADDFLCKPFSDAALFARVKNLIRVKSMSDDLQLREKAIDLAQFEAPHQDRSRGRVLLVANSVPEAAEWSDALSPWMDAVISVSEEAPRVLRRVLAERPDVCVIADTLCDGTDGLRLISSIRAQPDGREAAVLYALNVEQGGHVQEAYDVGATDYLAMPFHMNELVARVQSLVRRKKRSNRLRALLLDRLRQAMTDPLTGLANRRHALRQIRTLYGPEKDGEFAVLMLDLDRFKRVNDTHGHLVGDAVLKEFARRIQAIARETDTVARLGGEEFVYIQPGARGAEAEHMAERVRATIEEAPFYVSEGVEISVTVSIGAALSETKDIDPEMILRRADLALYASKSAGRNKVTVYSDAA